MFSTPLICCSSGVATEASTSVALAPMKVVVTWIIGGTISGYCAIGRPLHRDEAEQHVMIEITIATIGRLTKKRAMVYFASPAGWRRRARSARGAPAPASATTVMPSWIRCRPSTTTARRA